MQNNYIVERVTQKEKVVERMEADSQESEGLKMEPRAGTRKPLRARKTMTPSSRKQVELLKNLHRLGRSGSNTYSVQVKMIETERMKYCCTEETSPDLQKKIKSSEEPVAKLVLNSKISIYDDSPGVSRDRPYNGCNTDNNVSLQDLLFTLYEKESTCPVSKPVEVHLYSEQTSQPSNRPEERTSSLDSKTTDAPVSVISEKKKEIPENSAIAVLKQQLDSFRFRGGNSLSGDSLRESRTSQREEEVSCKRITSSVETTVTSSTQTDKSQLGLEKVKCLMQSCIEKSLGDLDCKLQQLNRRIDPIQCMQKYDGPLNQITKRVSKLEKDVNSIKDFQKAQLSHKVKLPSAQQKATILNVARPVPGDPNDPSIPSKRRLAQRDEVPSKTIRSSAKETCLDVEASCVQARSSADTQQKRASSNAQTSAEVLSNPCNSPEAAPAPKSQFLIDLTEEDKTNPDPPPESTTSKSPQPKTESSAKVPVQFPHLLPLPDPPPMNDFKDTLPPQKLELAVAQVKDPKGIALHWNIREVDPRCAPIESFHLYICHENKKGARSPWTKINEIKALPLPMACCISQIATSMKCYFAVQSKDVFGRLGPFCDIQSISTG